MIPLDFHGRDLIAERRVRVLGRLTARLAYGLSVAAIAFIGSLALIGFLTWPDEATATYPKRPYDPDTVALIGPARASGVPTPGSFEGLENREEVIAKPLNFSSWPKTTTAIAGGDVQPAELEINP